MNKRGEKHLLENTGLLKVCSSLYSLTNSESGCTLIAIWMASNAKCWEKQHLFVRTNSGLGNRTSHIASGEHKLFSFKLWKILNVYFLVILPLGKWLPPPPRWLIYFSPLTVKNIFHKWKWICYFITQSTMRRIFLMHQLKNI